MPANIRARVGRHLLVAGLTIGTLTFAGCGGTSSQDYGSFNRSTSGDVGSGYNTSIAGKNGTDSKSSAALHGVYPMIETSFQLPDVTTDPFDYEATNVQVLLKKPDNGTIAVTAFFDGDKTWRMRYSPTAPGTYAVNSVSLNGKAAHDEKLGVKDWTVKGDPAGGFVRVDKGDHSRFVLDGGQRFFPIGHNVAWQKDKQPDYAEIFAKMHAAGENWSRVWMDNWDGKSLDWKPATEHKFGVIDLVAAKRWDKIMTAAEKNDIYIQVVVQNHGAYSTTVDPNWDANPYNVKNGGFLKSPNEFFIDSKARALTKRKLHYLLARWGYSPNLMAIELFNEVENTDAWRNKQVNDVAHWHVEMALFLRQYDGYRHLITTSALPGVPLDSPVWETVDYVQQHTYTSDPVVALGTPEKVGKKGDKPLFVGEFGAQNGKDPLGDVLHDGLWAGILHSPAGAPEYWDWENVEKNDLYGQFKGATSFITASDLPGQGALVSSALKIDTTSRAELKFGPGGGWRNQPQNEFVVGKDGAPAGMENMTAYLQGHAHHEMTPKPLILHVDYPAAGTFSVVIAKVAKAGGSLVVALDGKSTDKAFAPADNDYVPAAGSDSLTVNVPQGTHTISIENTGADWVMIHHVALSDYAPALAGLMRTGPEFMAAWIYHRANLDAPATAQSPSATGSFTMPTLKQGHYKLTWWDTRNGKSIDTSELMVGKDKKPEVVQIPPVTRDIAVYVLKDTPKLAPRRTARRGRGRSKEANNGGVATPTVTATPATATSTAPRTPVQQTPATTP